MEHFTQLGRVIRYGLLNVMRDGFGSLSAIFINIITLFIIGASVLTWLLLDDTLERLSQKLDVTVYFSTESTEQQVLEFRDKLSALPQVAEAVYVSKEDALTEFKAKHENEEWLLEGLNILDENPLRSRISFRTHDSDDLESVTAYLQNEDLFSDNEITVIDDVDFYKNRSIIERLKSLISTISKFATIVISVLLIISLLIVTNTLHLIIYANRDEIEVMRLLGASRYYVRMPFLVSAAIYGILAGVVAIIALYPFAAWLNVATERFFGGTGLLAHYTGNFFFISVELIFTGVAISVLAGIFATWRYLR